MNRMQSIRNPGMQVLASGVSRIRHSSALLTLLLVACQGPVADVPGISGTELAGRLGIESAPFILDVRSAQEFKEGFIPGAVNIPYDELEKRLAELPADRASEVVVYCRSGRRAVIAEEILLAAGFSDVKDLEGHMLGWRESQLPVAR